MKMEQEFIRGLVRTFEAEVAKKKRQVDSALFFTIGLDPGLSAYRMGG
jgi:hypothetical protein